MFEYSNREVPSIWDYKRAVEVHNRIKPLMAGPDKGLRPVGFRRKTYQRIWLSPDGNVKVTECFHSGYVATEVTYFPTGLITIAFPNGSAGGGSLGFVQALLGTELNERGGRLWIHGVTALHSTQVPGGSRWQKQNIRVLGSFPVRDGGMIRIMREVKDNSVQMVLQDAVFPEVRRTLRDGAKAIRKRYEPFTKYMKGMLSMIENRDALSALPDNGNFMREHLLDAIQSDDPARHLQAVIFLCKANLGWRWSAAENWRDTKTAALRDLDRTLLDAHPDEAYAWDIKHDGAVYRDNVRLGWG